MTQSIHRQLINTNNYNSQRNCWRLALNMSNDKHSCVDTIWIVLVPKPLRVTSDTHIYEGVLFQRHTNKVATYYRVVSQIHFTVIPICHFICHVSSKNRLQSQSFQPSNISIHATRLCKCINTATFITWHIHGRSSGILLRVVCLTNKIKKI